MPRTVPSSSPGSSERDSVHDADASTPQVHRPSIRRDQDHLLKILGFDRPPREAPYEAPTENPVPREGPRHSVTSMRHASKEGDRLSVKGEAEAAKKAEEIAGVVREAPSGTIFAIVPSNIGRAQQTGDIMETRLREILAQEAVDFVDVHDRAGLEAAKHEPGRTLVITATQPQTMLGFKGSTAYMPAFGKYKKQFDGDEDLIGMTWIALPEEQEALRDEITHRLGSAPDGLDAASFVVTPEEAAATQILLSRRLLQIAKKLFGDRDVHLIQVGHSVIADFATLALMGKPLTLDTVRENGGKFRRAVESATSTFEDDTVETRYRDQRTERHGTIDDVLRRLEQEAATRKLAWGRTVTPPMTGG